MQAENDQLQENTPEEEGDTEFEGVANEDVNPDVDQEDDHKILHQPVSWYTYVY